MVKNQALAEDLLQEIFIKLWRSSATLDENANSLGPWLVTIARHHVFDYIKSGENRRAMKSATVDAVNLADPLSLPEHDFVFEEQVRLLRSGLGRLEERQYKVLELAYFEGFT
jgi:RNA polymerase sigma-70 factor (ECF subfamily)